MKTLKNIIKKVCFALLKASGIEVMEKGLPVPVSMHVKIIDDKGTTLWDALGITRERELKLIKLLEEANVDKQKLSTTLVKVSKHTIHPNELATVAFTLGSITTLKTTGLLQLIK